MEPNLEAHIQEWDLIQYCPAATLFQLTYYKRATKQMQFPSPWHNPSAHPHPTCFVHWLCTSPIWGGGDVAR